MKHTIYFIHGYSVGSDHSPVQLEVAIGQGEVQKSTYKWNVAHLGGDIGDKLRKKWASLPKEASFLFEFRNITRYYTQYSKLKVQENRKIKFDVKAKLEVATANLHNDIYNVDLQGEISRYKSILDEVEVRKTRGVMVRLKVK